MAKLRKRGNSYMIDYFDPYGKRVRQSFKKKKDAEAELGKRVSLIAEGRYLDVKKECTTTFKQLLERYQQEYGQQRSFDRWKRLCLEKFKASFGPETLVSNIYYRDLVDYRAGLRDTLTRKGTIRTDAYINREISCLQHVFAEAKAWGMIEKSPFEGGRTLLVKENNQRLRFLSDDEIPQLLEACPLHLRWIVTAAFNTWMRRVELLTLKWDQIRSGFIYLTKTKTDEPR